MQKRSIKTPATKLANAKANKPAANKPAPVTVAAVDTGTPTTPKATNAEKLARQFCRKASAGLSIAAFSGVSSARDNAYLDLLSRAAKQAKSASVNIVKLAELALANPGNLLGSPSHPSLDFAVLTARLLKAGYVEAPANVSDPANASIKLTAKALSSTIYANAKA